MSLLSWRRTRRRLEETLEHIQSLGVDWRRGRFGHYLRFLDSLEAQLSPRRGQGPSGDALKLLFEAGSQISQLLLAAAVFPQLDRSALRDAASKIMSGPQISAKGQDTPRDSLLELVSAGVMAEFGLQVDVTRGAEDVRVIHPAYGRGAVECKRPTKPSTILANLNDIGRQLKRRSETGCEFGIAVIGADRLVGTDAGVPLVVATSREEMRTTKRLGLDVGGQVADLANDPRCRLWPYASVIMVLFGGAVWVEDPPHLRPFFSSNTFQLGSGFLDSFPVSELRRPRRVPWPGE